MKTKTMLLGLGIFSLLTGSASFAQERVGNGGDAIVCGERVQLLDQYEASLPSRNIDITNLLGNTVREKVEGVVNSVAKLDRYNAHFLAEYAAEMINDAEIYARTGRTEELVISFRDVQLTDIDDSKELYIPSGCAKRQLVIQQNDRIRNAPMAVEKAKYIFQSVLWNQMDPNNKALTILHEAWYRIALQHGAVNSIATRLVNVLTASKPSVAVYIEKMQQVPFEIPNGYSFTYQKDGVQKEYLLLFPRGYRTDNVGNQCHPVIGRGSNRDAISSGSNSFPSPGSNLDRIDIMDNSRELCFHPETRELMSIKTHAELDYTESRDIHTLLTDQGRAELVRGSNGKLIATFATGVFPMALYDSVACGASPTANIDAIYRNNGTIEVSSDGGNKIKYRLNRKNVARGFKKLVVSQADGKIISVE